MFEKLTGMFRRQPPAKKSMTPPALKLEGSYDSTARTPENARHWSWIDYRSADSSLQPEVRKQIRAQSRYELQENNCYGRGMAETIVTDVIGTGPRLQVSEFSQSDNQKIERLFGDWMRAVGFSDKLSTMRMARLVDGESVARFVTNLSVDNPVSLDVQLIECDQLTSPNWESILTDTYVDGVRLDRFGNPVAYDILKHHPGTDSWDAMDFYAYDTYPASQIIHQFKQTRPGQHRGISEFAPALPLFAFLRRFTLATVAAAETAANVSQVITTDAPIPEELEDEFAATSFEKFMDTIPIDRNSATVLPNQWKLNQFAPEHPTTTYAMFKREIVAEVGRVVGLPVNMALIDSGDSNYSSARFDHLGYERTVKKDQDYTNRSVMDRVFAEWLLEAAVIGLLPRRISDKVLKHNDEYGRRGLSNAMQHAWHWDNMRDADQQNAAQAERLRMQNGTQHRARAYAEQGLDVEVEDIKAAEALGMTVPKYREWVAASIFTNGNIIGSEPGESESGESDPEASGAEEESSSAEEETSGETAKAGSE